MGNYNYNLITVRERLLSTNKVLESKAYPVFPKRKMIQINF